MSAQEFMNLFHQAGRDIEEKTRELISELREKGVKALHPNDGWIDRENKIAQFCYPRFNDGVNIGDKIALGDYRSHTIVEVYDIVETNFLTKIVKYYYR